MNTPTNSAASRLHALRATGKSDAECARILRFEAAGYPNDTRDTYTELADKIAPRATTLSVRSADVFSPVLRAHLRRFR